MTIVTVSFTEENSMILSVTHSHTEVTVTHKIVPGIFLASTEPLILPWHAKMVFILASSYKDVPIPVKPTAESFKSL
ncbi:Hypothetical predicted protein [Octopus vulgaris]|uniref:Uncharacterized protein n=1 Tax=Octopus vulgaris TaxID=6645 RepID=A0AA36B089_OCTVU|nr:Hypothetical predicted protein [Octopus vulgaris]